MTLVPRASWVPWAPWKKVLFSPVKLHPWRLTFSTIWLVGRWLTPTTLHWNRNQVYSSITSTLTMLHWRERHIVNQAQCSKHRNINIFLIMNEKVCACERDWDYWRVIEIWIFVISTKNNFVTEHDTTESITPFHSESTARFNDISISHIMKKIGCEYDLGWARRKAPHHGWTHPQNSPHYTIVYNQPSVNVNTQNWWKSPYCWCFIKILWWKLVTWCFIKILQFLQCAQNTKHFISVDSPSWAEQNVTNNFVIACTVVEILTFKYLQKP